MSAEYDISMNIYIRRDSYTVYQDWGQARVKLNVRT